MSHLAGRWAISAVAVLAMACTDPLSDSSKSLPEQRHELDQTLACLPGCTEQDPYPTAAGIWLTSAVTDGTCFGSGTDRDQDGLIDRCERDIAAAFAPELNHWNIDNVGREPKWAARPMGGKVMVAYLFSYYRDEGSAEPFCNLPFAPSSCHGHNGDNEVVFIVV